MAKNYWPHAIVLSLILIVLSCVATIVVAVKNPVEMDSFYFERYQNVDENINEIEASQKRFSDKFDVKFSDLSNGLDGKFEISLVPKNGANLEQILAKAMLTRPTTNELNRELNATFQGQILKINTKIPKEGRWQILLKLNDTNDTGFYKFGFETR